MIEAVLTPLLLVLVAGVAGWRSGTASSGTVWRVLRRARAAWRLLLGRSPLCAVCRRRLEVQGATVTLCERCDPVHLAMMDPGPTP